MLKPLHWISDVREVAEFKRVDRPCRAVLIQRWCPACKEARYYVRVDLADGTCEYPILIKRPGYDLLAWDTPWHVPKYAVKLAWKAFRLREQLEKEIT